MSLQCVSQRDAEFAAFALSQVVERLRARGNNELADRAAKVMNGLKTGGVIVVDGTA